MPLVCMQSDEVVGEVGRKKKKYIDPKCIVHNKTKRYCLPCGGKPQANTRCLDHNRRKQHCVECGGKKRIQKRCKDHNKTQCVQCGYAAPRKCSHGIQKYRCIPCEGSGICKHKFVRANCVQCKGANICRHEIKRRFCRECDGSYLCLSCLFSIVCKKGTLCSKCNPTAFTRSPSKEAGIASHLETWASEGLIPIYDAWNKPAAGSSTTICGAFRPDFAWHMVTHSVILEVDEHQHSAYKPKCEFQRICNLSGSFGGPIFIIRFNPDKYTIAGKKRNPERRHRLTLLLQRIQHALTTIPSTLITVEYLHYSQIKQSQEHVQCFSFKEQSCMAKWIDELEPKWDDISIAHAIESAVEATSTT